MTYQEFIEEWLAPDPYCKVRTSGSTGEPKLIRLPKSVMLKSAERTIEFLGLKPHSRIHSCISPDYIGGKMMAVRALSGNLRLTFENPSNHPEILTSDDDAVPDLVALVPSQFLHILNSDIPERFKKTIWLLGGSSVPDEMRKRIAESGLDVRESYGMTETSSHIAIRKISAEETPFIPLRDVALSSDQRGCLVISQFGETITTNDLVEFYPDGKFKIVGRADNVLITGGKKVNPEKIERLLSSPLNQLGIRRIMLRGEPDEKWGARLVLIVENPSEGLTDFPDMKAKINLICKSILENHEVPKEIIFVKEIPLTPTGKLNRRRNLSEYQILS